MNIYIVTLCYCPARILLTTLDQVYKTIGIAPKKHVALNQHYPKKDEERNDRLIQSICKEFNVELLDLGENVGLSRGYNHLVSYLNPRPDDVIIGIDHDVFPVTKDWGQAIVKVASYPIIGWASLSFAVVDREMDERGFDPAIVDGVGVKLPRQVCMSSICAVRYEVWKEIGGINEPKPYYGGAECATWPKLSAIGKRWAYLTEFREEHSPLVSSEPLYGQYKVEYALKNTTNLDYRSWLLHNKYL